MSLVRKFFSKNTLLLMTSLMSFSLLTTALANNQKNNSVQEVQADYSNSDYFIDPNRDIRTDYENINSQNWMSFVSGERTLNTINIPGTHDSAMKEIFTFKGGLIRSDSRAKTQYLYIDEQLNAGVRRLDLRLNSQYKDDDGWHVSIYDLTLAHGKTSMGGTYFAENKNGDHLRLTEVIGYLRDFLTAHPSEAIVISYQSESQEDVYRNEIYRTAFNRFQEFSKQINPSTGKSFVHMQDDKFGVPYTSFPKLKDCRGQILLSCDTALDEPFCPFPGGFTKDFLKEHKIEPKGDYEDDADEKIDHVTDYYEDYPVRTLSRVDESDETLYQVGLNCTDPDPIFGIPTPPLDLADDILDHFFYDGRSDSPFIDNTRRLGWVNFDGVKEEVCRPVYMSNLLEALSSVNIFIEVFLYRNLDDPEDVEGVGTCAYTMKRWTSLMERYEALSDTGKSILADDPEAQAFIFGMKLLLERYDLVIKNYGTDMYPDFLHRFSGPVVGTLNYRLDSDLFNSTSTVVLIVSIASCSSIALTALLIIKKRKNRK